MRKKLYLQAKQEPNFRFHQLWDKVWRGDILEHAWRVAKANEGTAGVDGVTFQRIESQGCQQWWRSLQEDLRSKSCRPRPVRRVMIPKPGGGQRPLGIPAVRERVARSALKLVIEPIFEADWDPEAHGYRPKRSAPGAIRRVHQLLLQGCTDVAGADFPKYFAAIPRGGGAAVHRADDGADRADPEPGEDEVGEGRPGAVGLSGMHVRAASFQEGWP